MQIMLVRHGQPAWTRDGMGVTNPPLTDIGLAQAERTAERLSTMEIDDIVVSPLLRAQQTVAPIAAATGIEPTTHEWLAEIGNPDAWDTTPAKDIERVFAEARDRHVDEHWEGLPGGESFRAFHDRVTSGFRRWLVAEGATPAHPFPPLWNIPAPDRRVVVVAHAGTNAVLLTELLGMTPVPWEWERFVTFHASITELRPMPISGAHSFSLFRLSDIAHFDPDLQTY